MLLIRNGVGAVLLLAVAACATLEPEPSEDQIEAAVAAKFHDLKGAITRFPGLNDSLGSILGPTDLTGLRKQRCAAEGDVRRPSYLCTVTLDVKTLLGTLHPTIDLRFIRSASGWAVADLP